MYAKQKYMARNTAVKPERREKVGRVDAFLVRDIWPPPDLLRQRILIIVSSNIRTLGMYGGRQRSKTKPRKLLMKFVVVVQKALCVGSVSIDRGRGV